MEACVRSKQDLEAVLLCGGMGRRLQAVVHDRPKPMAEINGRPFLDILIGRLKGLGCKRFVLCTGYRGEAIRRYYQDKADSGEIVFSQEPEPLGTAGALKNAEALIQGSYFLVANGDSLCKFALSSFLDFHLRKKALVSIALIKGKATQEIGAVRLDVDQKVVGFCEKNADPHPGYLVNTGTYIFNRKALSFIPQGKNYSLEYDLFPSLNGCYGYVIEGTLIDIGTPQSYTQAKRLLR